MIHDTKKYKKQYMMRKNIKTIYNTFYELMTMLVTIPPNRVLGGISWL